MPQVKTPDDVIRALRKVYEGSGLVLRDVSDRSQVNYHTVNTLLSREKPGEFRQLRNLLDVARSLGVRVVVELPAAK